MKTLYPAGTINSLLSTYSGLTRKDARRYPKRVPIADHQAFGAVLMSAHHYFTKKPHAAVAREISGMLDDIIQCEYSPRELPTETFRDCYFKDGVPQAEVLPVLHQFLDILKATGAAGPGFDPRYKRIQDNLSAHLTRKF